MSSLTVTPVAEETRSTPTAAAVATVQTFGSVETSAPGGAPFSLGEEAANLVESSSAADGSAAERLVAADRGDFKAPQLDSAMTAGASSESSATDADVRQVATFVGLYPSDGSSLVEVEGVPKDTAAASKPAVTFEDLKLPEALLKGVYAMRFAVPSKIQLHALPILLSTDRPNLIGQAQNGAGKTVACALAMLAACDASKASPQCICVCPARELARRAVDVAQTLGMFTKSDVGFAASFAREEMKQQIVFGTPGTLLAKIRRRELDVRNVHMLAVDGGDQLLEQQGSADTTVQLKKLLPKTAQVLFLASTFPQNVRAFAEWLAPKAVRVNVKSQELSLATRKHFVMDVKDERDKYPMLLNLYGLLNIGQSIIFVHTVKTAKELAHKMRSDGFVVSLLHGTVMPDECDKVMQDFRAGRSLVMIATSVLARGIDILQVSLIINYDLPLTKENLADPDTYLHRIGRTGCFGRRVVAINFTHDEQSRLQLKAIEEHFRIQMTALPPSDLEETEALIMEAFGRARSKPKADSKLETG